MTGKNKHLNFKISTRDAEILESVPGSTTSAKLRYLIHYFRKNEESKGRFTAELGGIVQAVNQHADETFERHKKLAEFIIKKVKEDR